MRILAYLCHGLVIIFVLAGCTSFKKLGQNDSEGFVKKEITFKDYTTLGNEFEPLANLLLKLENIHFNGQKIQERPNGDTLKWMTYDCQVRIKLIEDWNLVGISTSKPKKINLKFQLWISNLENQRIYESSLQGQYIESEKLGLENQNIKVSNRTFPILFTPDDSDGTTKFLSIYTPNNIVKFVYPVRGVNQSPSVDWLLNYVTYDLTRGIAFIIDGETYELGLYPFDSD